MEKKITVYVVTLGTHQVTYLTKGEAEKAVAVLNSFSLTASLESAKRTATIS